jgi:plastocyanin
VKLFLKRDSITTPDPEARQHNHARTGTVARMQRHLALLLTGLSLTLLLSARTVDAQPAPTVTIDNYAYQPAEITVAPGTTVTWTNAQTDDVHSTTSNDGVWDSDTLDTGSSFKFTFNDPGDYGYYCSQHPDMQGVVHVSGD